MKIIRENDSVYKKIEFEKMHPHIISFVGAGGKTTLLYRLASELGQMGYKVLITTTTKMFLPEEDFYEWGNSEGLKAMFEFLDVVVTGCRYDTGKITGIPIAEYEKLHEMADVILVEADGSNRRPVKVPAAHEPVLFPGSDMVVGVIGMRSIGMKIEDAAHRVEDVCAFLEKPADHRLKKKELEYIAESPAGLKKGISCRYVAVLNHFTPIQNEDIRMRLQELADDSYQEFSSALIPNIPKECVLGVRLPILRGLAKDIAKSNWRYYLEHSFDEYFEERMLQGMVIGYAKMKDFDEFLHYIRKFVPKINCWSICDSFCAGLKTTKEHKKEMFKFLNPYLKSDGVYEIRFAVVMLLWYYAEPQYVKEAFAAFDQIKHEDYYVKMAVAWAVSIYYTKLPEETVQYLRNNQLDDWTYNKALQKITESRTVGTEIKKKIREMKR